MLRHAIPWPVWLPLVVIPPVHDEPMPGAWMCGRCPYMNVGSFCTKCGGARYYEREG